MGEMWIETKTEVNTIDWRGNPICLTDVPALQNTKTKKIRVYPSEVSKAEIAQIAIEYDLTPRDVPLILMLYAKPGIFKAGEVNYKYHINKMLFYQWKDSGKEGLGETFPHDEFEPKRRGPVPMNIDNDLKHLKDLGIISTSYKRWGKGSKDESLTIALTKNGLILAEKLWCQVPEPLRETTQSVKEKIFPLSPDSVKELVHKQYPEYRRTYIDEDRD